MRKTIFTAIASAVMFVGGAAHAATMTVYKSPSCGCCGKWVEHVEKHGFKVTTVPTADVMTVKKTLGVPQSLASCHTTKVGNYVIEGHVPAVDIKRLLATKSKVRGIAVAGMPMGSPGMEHGHHREPYATVAFDAAGKTKVFAQH